MSEFEKKITGTIDDLNLFSGVQKIAVAFSGGKDSSALMHFLSGFAKDRKITLEAIHINHLIRGENAQRDEDFCKKICDGENIHIEVRRINVPSLSKELQCGLEEAGRIARYNAFFEISKERGIDCIVTAHHANDNLETVILNMSRGSGLKGLRGIPEKRDIYVRPMLSCTGADIDEYVMENNIPYVEDETNTDTAYSRNRIRGEIIPSLEKINPQVVQNVYNMSRMVKDDEDYLIKCASEYKGELKDAHMSLLSRIVILKAPAGLSVEYDHVKSICDALKKQKDIRISVGGSYDALVKDGELEYIKCKREKTKKEEYQNTLTYGINRIPGDDKYIFLSYDRDEFEEYKKDKTVLSEISINKNALCQEIIFRNRQSGDRMNVKKCHKRLKNLLQEANVNTDIRENLPIVCDGDGPLWIPCVARRDDILGNDIHMAYIREEK